MSKIQKKNSSTNCYLIINNLFNYYYHIINNVNRLMTSVG